MIVEAIVWISVFINLFIAISVYSKNSHSATNILLAINSLVMAFWSILQMISLRPMSAENRMIFVRLVMVVTAFFPPAFFLLAKAFPDTKITIGKRFRNFIIIILSVVVLLSISPLMFSSLKNLPNNSFELSPGPGIIFFGFNLLFFLIYGFKVLFVKFFKSTGREKVKLGLFLWGMIISIVMIIFTNFFVVVVLGSVKLSILGPVSTIFFTGLTAYSIVRYKFLDIRLIIIRSVSYLGLLLILATTYIGGAILISNLIVGGKISFLQISIQTILTIIVAFTFHPLRLKLEKLTNNFFFQSLPDEQEFLKSIGVLVSKTLDIKSLASNLVRKFIKDFQLEKAVFLLKDEKDLKIVYQKGTNNSLDHSRLEDFSRYFKANLDLVDELKNPKAKRYLRDHNYSIILKLVNKDQVLGYILLGDKKSGAGFYGQELKLIELSAPSISVALTNAIQYAQIEAFSETLKAKVVEATGKLRKANKKLKDLDQRKDEFLSIAAHEMRAPLTAVKGYLSMVMDGDVGKLSKDIKQMLKGALVGADREIRLVNSMLNVSRIEENRMVYNVGEINLAEVVDNTFLEFKIQAKEKGLQFTLDIADKIKDKVKVDQDRIHEVVANFVSNAIKYTDQGQVIMRLYNSDKKTVRFTVSDSGYGMTKEEQAKLFQKFYRAESSAGKVLGTGLGLYTTKLLVEKFGGTIGVESKKGEGSTFWFELPLK